ncbi:MAG: hypothetical protein K9L56_14595 [Clostridiales bacterium]|nr:hypothetical protein [Clostridiales bacterium]
MEWADYVKEAMKTAIYPGDFASILYTALGLPDEVYEFFESIGSGDEVKELGDCCWYVACFSKECGIDIEETQTLAGELEEHFPLESIFDAAEQMKGSSSRICGLVKKYMRDEQFWTHRPSVDKKAKIQLELAHIILSVYYICDTLGVSWQEVAKKNIEKLSSRQERGKLQGSGNDR